MTNASEPSLEADLQLLRSAAVAAGIVALGLFRRPIASWTKNNSSPVTDADIAVDDFLFKFLTGARPDYGWLSEESGEDEATAHATLRFIIDPIDGTRAFMRGDDNWTLSLAIVGGVTPLCGVVYAPARDEMYHARLGGGGFLNGKLMASPQTTGEDPMIPAPAAVHDELDKLGLSHRRGPAPSSLAYRLVQVARGTIDAAVARRGAEDWDVAAAALILSECGIALEDVCTGQLPFARPNRRHAALAAVRYPEHKTPIHTALRLVYGCPAETEEIPHKRQQSS